MSRDFFVWATRRSQSTVSHTTRRPLHMEPLFMNPRAEGNSALTPGNGRFSERETAKALAAVQARIPFHRIISQTDQSTLGRCVRSVTQHRSSWLLLAEPSRLKGDTSVLHTQIWMSSKRNASIWNIDMSRDLSDPWTRFHTVYSIGRKTSRRKMWSGKRLMRKQPTSRPDHSRPELWTSMGKNAKLKERQKLSNEKLHLDNARKL